MSKLQELIEARKAKQVLAQDAMYDNETYLNMVLAKKDTTILNEIIENIEKASGADTFRRGFKFNENVEKVIGICSALQYAKKEVRELIPTEYYTIFDSGTRDIILEANGNTPYLKERTLLEAPDGTMKELGAEKVELAKAGTPADIQALNAGLASISFELELLVTLEATQAQQDKAWADAKAKLETQVELQKVQDAYAKAIKPE